MEPSFRGLLGSTAAGGDGLAGAIGRLRSLDGVEIVAGILEQDGRRIHKAGKGEASLALIAAANEYGARIPRKGGGVTVIPPRPWMRTTAREKLPKVKPWMYEAIRQHNRGNDASAILRKVAVSMVGALKETLLDGPWTPNAPSTVRKKKSAQPLIDTGLLNASQRARISIPGRSDEIVG